MPEVSLLVELAGILQVTVNDILLPMGKSLANANFEHVLLPYEDIADFSGRKWPRSMAQPAILSAIKLLMGLECRKDIKGNLKNIYPAARKFGFNNPDGLPDDNPAHGYERWISIPDGLDVPEPLVRVI